MNDQTQAPLPVIDHRNPGRGHTVKVAFSNQQDETWSESVNLITALSDVLTQNQYAHTKFDSWITLPAGLILQPQIVAIDPLDSVGVKSTTTIEITFGTENEEQSLFEYQHSSGSTVIDSISNGFEAWISSDLVVILEAISGKFEHCTRLEMTIPELEGTRLAVLGPITYYAKHQSAVQEEHPFCPCCLLTNNFEMFRQQIRDTAVYGIRMFAMRKENGDLAADCRINGHDYQDGKASLINYAQSWPNCDFEFRKQYVILISK